MPRFNPETIGPNKRWIQIDGTARKECSGGICDYNSGKNRLNRTFGELKIFDSLNALNDSNLLYFISQFSLFVSYQNQDFDS